MISIFEKTQRKYGFNIYRRKTNEDICFNINHKLTLGTNETFF